jgi:RNA polymerase sigma-70 factor (ECF subfamily)
MPSTGTPEGGPQTGEPVRLTPLRELQLLEIHRANGPDAHKALTELLAGYQRRIYSICLRMVSQPEDAADLTQDVLLKLVESLGTYDGRAKLSTWIIRITMNACLSHRRRGKVRAERPLETDHIQGLSPSPLGRTAQGQAEPSAGASVEQDQQRRVVARALERLDPDARSILVLRDVQDLDYQQLAEVLDVPLGTVKSRLFRARALLRDAVKALGGE